MLQIHFESFDYLQFVVTQETYVDFLCKNFLIFFFQTQLCTKLFFSFLAKLGGWMGLAFGASVISFMELSCFMAKFLLQMASYRY